MRGWRFARWALPRLAAGSLCRGLAVMAASLAIPGAMATAPEDAPGPAGDSAVIATTGHSGRAEARDRGWRMVERLSLAPLSVTDAPDSSWFTRDAVFDPTDGHARQRLPAPDPAARAALHAVQLGNEELIVVTLYNAPAYQHIRDDRLHDPLELERLRGLLIAQRRGSSHDARTPFPAFPQGSAIVLTAWWPVAPDGVTALPVWDPELNPPNPKGNGYLTWKRIVAIDPGPTAGEDATIPVAFAGRPKQVARRVSLASLRHVPVDDGMALRLMRDQRSRKAVLIALGRPLRAGDWLAMVALHAVEKREAGWTWATLWWHDAPDEGAFARVRPGSLQGPLRNYLLDVDDAAPVDAAGKAAARSCFNPWLEARFPDGGSGGGVSSNCIACHRRASHPAVNFLPVRRGEAGDADDPATDPSQLGTDFVWSIARHAAQTPAALSRSGR